MLPKYTEKQALDKLQHYCAYQERCAREVLDKLREWGWGRSESEVLLLRLQEEGFIDERRFAQAYVSGKFRLKRWGRIKIEQGLRGRGISESLIKQALKTGIDEAEYRRVLSEVLEAKARRLDPELQPALRRQKLFAAGMAAGYESDLLSEWLNGGFGDEAETPED